MGKQKEQVETPESKFKQWLHGLVCKVMAPHNPDPTIQRHVPGFPGILCEAADYYVEQLWTLVSASNPQPLVSTDLTDYDMATAKMDQVWATLMAPYKPEPFNPHDDYPTARTLTNMVVAEYIDKIMGYKGWRIGKLHHMYPKLHLKAEKWIHPDTQYYADMIAALPSQELKDLKQRLDDWISDYKAKACYDDYSDIPEADQLQYKGVHYMEGSVCDQIITWAVQAEAQLKGKPGETPQPVIFRSTTDKIKDTVSGGIKHLIGIPEER